MDTDDRQEFISRRLMLPAHVWLFIEREAASECQGDIPRVVQQMYDQARAYRVFIEVPPRKPRRRKGVAL
jgi:hypothetical protein